MLLQIFSLVLHFAVGLIAGTCLLRAYLHWQRIPLSRSSGNPLAPFVFGLTNWIVLPVRRFVPAVGPLDTASLVVAYAMVLAKYALLSLVAGANGHGLSWVLHACFELVNIALSGLLWLVVAYALVSWFNAASDVRYVLARLVEPLLRPLRRVLPHMGQVDLSPIALLLLIQIAEIMVHHLQASVVF